MVQLETYEDIINTGKALKQALMDTFGFHVTSGSGDSFDAGFTVKNSEIAFSFPYGRDEASNKRLSRWELPRRKCEMYDNATEKVLMTKEQFMELFKEYFGDTEYEEFQWSGTWGVRIPLKATKAVAEIWAVKYLDEPKKVLILRQTEKTITVGDRLNDPYPEKLNLSEVIGKTYFWNYEEAYECYKQNVNDRLYKLLQDQKELESRIQYVKELQSKLH